MTDASLFFRRAPVDLGSQSVGGSPWSYTNSSDGIQILNISGGTVSGVEVDSGGGFVPKGETSGDFSIFPGEIMKVTYSSKPTVMAVQL